MNYQDLSVEDLTEFCTKEYKEIKLKTAELKKAQDALFAKMADNKMEEVKSPFGRFYQYSYVTYKFPEDVIAIKNALVEAEEKAKAEGRAEKIEVPKYKFGELKKDDNF